MIFPRLHLDKETRSAKELGKSPRNVGLYRYANDPTTSVWMFSYRFEYAPGVYGPVLRWWRGEPLPQDVITHIALGLPVLGHNVTFERTIWNQVLRRQVGGDLPLISIEQTDCTMARARAVGLPGDLERAAEVVNAPVKKNMAGKDKMLKMSKPRSIVFSTETAGRHYHANDCVVQAIPDSLVKQNRLIEEQFWILQDPPGYSYGVMTITWWYDLNLRNDLSTYCDDDVYAECGVDQVVPALSPSERELWELDQKINDRGILIDRPFVRKVTQLIEMAIGRGNREMWTLTAGKVKKCGDHGAVRKWLVERGYADITSVAKGETEGLLVMTEKDKDASRVVALHNAFGNTGKFKKALEVICDDDRARGQFTYHVANATGRWAGSGIQLQNMLRVDEDRELPTLRRLIELIEAFDVPTAFDLIGAV